MTLFPLGDFILLFFFLEINNLFLLLLMIKNVNFTSVLCDLNTIAAACAKIMSYVKYYTIIHTFKACGYCCLLINLWAIISDNKL